MERSRRVTTQQRGGAQSPEFGAAVRTPGLLSNPPFGRHRRPGIDEDYLWFSDGDEGEGSPSRDSDRTGEEATPSGRGAAGSPPRWAPVSRPGWPVHGSSRPAQPLAKSAGCAWCGGIETRQWRMTASRERVCNDCGVEELRSRRKDADPACEEGGTTSGGRRSLNQPAAAYGRATGGGYR